MILKVLLVTIMLPFLFINPIYAEYSSDFSYLSKVQLVKLYQLIVDEPDNTIVYTNPSEVNMAYTSTLENYDSNTLTATYTGWSWMRESGSIGTREYTQTIDLSSDTYDILYVKYNGTLYYSVDIDSIDCFVSVNTISSPSDSGSISGGGTYFYNDSVTLTATANDGYQFLNWSNGETSPNLIFTARSDVTYTAYFQQISSSNTYTITASVSPFGYGYVDGTGTYTEGSLVTLSAHAYDGYRFKNWNTGSTSSYLTFNINENRDYIAYFEIDPNYTPPEQDKIIISGSVSPINSGYINGLGEYDLGETITLTAVANDGYTFVKWNNGNTSPTQTINSMSDLVVTAYFVSDDFSSSSILYEDEYILLDYICSNNTSYTYRNKITKIYAPNMNVYASVSSSSNYQLIAENVSEFVISGIVETQTSDSCYFVPFIENSRTGFLSDGVTISSYDGLVTYKFVLAQKYDPIVDGTIDSNIATDNNDTQNVALDSTLSNFESAEQSYNDSIDSGLNSIDFSPVSFSDSFMKSSAFVVDIFDGIVMSSPLGDYLTIVLIIGLFLLIVGRYL